ncbi:hypothetical protein ACFSTE_17130 [Aquimarina hainanensis]|uniref:Uncharacterized protein n=1 Tax=Aquimarina hainanensis TaxID=1578017 RepID=A0ABW5NDA1_9FLAO|nr:hypothetical protein [Aquimarina sp. TRL1]QKX06938.1 hypothetical protein HN014_19105 [Aquimarina sp. TRL1]
MFEQRINCPNCGTPIPFDVHILLQGKGFTCSGCNASIKLSRESKDTVASSMEEFDKIKKNSFKTAP